MAEGRRGNREGPGRAVAVGIEAMAAAAAVAILKKCVCEPATEPATEPEPGLGQLDPRVDHLYRQF